MSTRRTPPLNLTLPLPAREALDALAAEDAAETGTDPSRQRSATVARLVLEETARRARRKNRQATP